MTPKIQSIDEYLAQQPTDVQAALASLRAIIHEVQPKVEETLSYQVPTFKFHGALVSFAAAKNHCSFYIMSSGPLQQLAKELTGFKISGTAVHFTPQQPLPAGLVRKLVQARCDENQAKAVK